MVTAIGGLIGATVGTLIGLPIANASSEGGLEAVAIALIILFLSLCVGAAVGVGVALKMRSQDRPVITALVSLPSMFAAAYIALFAAGRSGLSDVLLLPLLAVVSYLALLAARAISLMLGSSGRDQGFRGE